MAKSSQLLLATLVSLHSISSFANRIKYYNGDYYDLPWREIIHSMQDSCEDDDPDDCDYCLTKPDFEQGTVRLTEPGTYCLKENIYFNPSPGSIDKPNLYGSWFPDNDELYPGCVDNSNGAFSLGFFAAISIESSDIELNLNGYTIQMHWYFYLQQRWFSIIEIANSPFLPNVGPADFGHDWEHISNVKIHNGELGLSSHHGIHSNNATNITIENLVINEFEVAGIALNGFDDVLLKDLEIGPSFRRVPFTGI